MLKNAYFSYFFGEMVLSSRELHPSVSSHLAIPNSNCHLFLPLPLACLLHLLLLPFLPAAAERAASNVCTEAIMVFSPSPFLISNDVNGLLAPQSQSLPEILKQQNCCPLLPSQITACAFQSKFIQMVSRSEIKVFLQIWLNNFANLPLGILSWCHHKMVVKWVFPLCKGQKVVIVPICIFDFSDFISLHPSVGAISPRITNIFVLLFSALLTPQIPPPCHPRAGCVKGR